MKSQLLKFVSSASMTWALACATTLHAQSTTARPGGKLSGRSRFPWRKSPMALPIPSTLSVRVMVPPACSSSNVLVWSKSWIKTGKSSRDPSSTSRKQWSVPFWSKAFTIWSSIPISRTTANFMSTTRTCGSMEILSSWNTKPRRIIPTERTSIRPCSDANRAALFQPQWG